MIKKVEGTSVDAWIATGKDWVEFISDKIFFDWTFKNLPLFDCKLNVFGDLLFDVNRNIKNDTDTLWLFVKYSGNILFELSIHDLELINKAWDECYE